MSKNFKALVINQSENNFTREIKNLEKGFLKHGDVLVKVDYSGLNYKDALILKNGAKLVKEFPHIPGIDFSGTVLESENSKFKEGDEIILSTDKGKMIRCEVKEIRTTRRDAQGVRIFKLSGDEKVVSAVKIEENFS